MPDDMKTEIGALISKNHFDKVQNYVEEGIKEGGELLLGKKLLPILMAIISSQP